MEIINTHSERIPAWLRRPAGNSSKAHQLKQLLRKSKLNTVCEEARCPNISECFSRQTATFMILGDVCTRGCRFCSVQTGKPTFLESNFEQEAIEVARAAKSLGLKHVVLTSVARDDLADGGASGFYHTIRAVKKQIENSTVEVLVPDFRGNRDALKHVLSAGPDVFNHNLETVPRLYREVRPGTSYVRSLELLQAAKELLPGLKTKTGLMLGLGEEEVEVLSVIKDAVKYKVDIFTAGQYMQPSRNHLRVKEYLRPEEFDAYAEKAKEFGIAHAHFGPLVRSSYHADEFV